MTKIIFVVDTSGSNVHSTRNAGTLTCLETDVDFLSCTPPTDPRKLFRGGAIQQFLDQYGTKSNFQWGFMTFAGTAAHSLINVAGDDQNPYMSANPNDLQFAIDTFYLSTDDGATPYKSAINMVTKAIATDRDLDSADSPQYFMILLTDGFPTDYGTPSTGFDLSSLQADVQTLLSVAPGRISLSAIYYGQVNDQNAISLLQMMVSAGHGQFARANSVGSSLTIDDVIPGTSCGGSTP